MSNATKAAVSESRTADKFMVRFDEEGQRSKVEELAKQERRSMNSWILEAIDEKLARAERQELLLDSLEKALHGDTVITTSTHAEETLDRVLEKLKTAMPGSKVLQ
jgi:16S rRNA C967 or C1407 C5-methylase (RsmB/RsmF family)